MKKKNIIISIIVLILAAAIVIACCIGSQDVNGKWCQNPNVLTWFDNWGKGQEKPDDDTSKDNISLASYALEAADFAAYGISPQALEAKVLKVDFEPVNTTNKRVGWVCKWKNSNSSWAINKNINDYLDFVPAVDFGASATLAVKQPFGEPVIVTATSRANAQLTSSCQFDYVARYCDVHGGDSFWVDSLNEFYQGFYFFDDFVLDYDEYTVVPDRVFASIDFTFFDDCGRYLSDLAGGCNTSFSDYWETTDGYLPYEVFINYNDNLSIKDLSSYVINTGNNSVGRFKISVECCYGEVSYSFSTILDLEFSDKCAAEMSTPPTNITINPDGGAF